MKARERFLSSYLDTLPDIEGWFSPDAALMFMAYNQLLAARGLSGDVLEIGVHHGKSAIAVAALRGKGRRFFAVDLFEELQAQNHSGSGSGSKAAFLRNMDQFFDDTGFMRAIAGASGDLTPSQLGYEFAFCHIDGGHSAAETYGDLDLSYRISLPGGLIALDDYFNPAWPGVSEGAIRYALDHPGALIPIAIGFNKVLLQRSPVPFDLNAAFHEQFPNIPRATSIMWEGPASLFDAGFTRFLDLEASTPHALVPSQGAGIRVAIDPLVRTIQVPRQGTAEVLVRVANESGYAFPWGSTPAGVSYHLFGENGEVIRWDNPRSFFERPLEPREERTISLPVSGPDAPGSYQVEIDIVWEGKMWLKESGNPTKMVELTAV
jgi:hypothetical protein